MAIYRGTGGSSTTTDETTVNAVNQKAAEAATSASSAASSASSAATSASTANTKASQASTSADSAATSATSASASKDAAATSATNAAASELAAEDAKTAAEAAETNAILYGNMANTAAGDADADRILAEAAASTAQTYATQVTTSTDAAAASATAAALSETNAAASESAAATSETNAGNSADAANVSANDAATSEANAAASETASAASAASASTSATAAANSATAASTSASAAATSATTATTKASEAATSATNAATSETNAAASESAAATSATAASAAKDAALAALDSFDDRYLGVKSSDPTLDNDGNALASGALYFNDTSGVMKVYDGSQWLAAYADLSGALIATSNLSDLTNVATARTNLGLGTAATTASTDYATAAQGALADSALQSFTETDPVYTASSWYTTTNNSSNWDTAYSWGNHASAGYADAATVTTALAGKVDDSQVLTNVPAGAVFTDTTYSVGNGGLTEINFTSARSSKLDGIEAGAQVNVPTNLGSGATSTTVSIVSSTGSNTSVPAATTSTAGVLTAADKTKLDGIATNANNYSHPTYAGDDFSIDTGALSGATVISDLDFNVTTDTLGHVTDANATYSTRNLTAADIGAQPAGSYLTTSTGFGGDVSGTYNAIVVANDSHTHDGRYYTESESNARYAYKAGSGSQAFSASTLNATTVDLGNWTVTESSGVLYFATLGVNKMKLDASGNLSVVGDVAAYATL